MSGLIAARLGPQCRWFKEKQKHKKKKAERLLYSLELFSSCLPGPLMTAEEHCPSTSSASIFRIRVYTQTQNAITRCSRGSVCTFGCTPLRIYKGRNLVQPESIRHPGLSCLWSAHCPSFSCCINTLHASKTSSSGVCFMSLTTLLVSIIMAMVQKRAGEEVEVSCGPMCSNFC